MSLSLGERAELARDFIASLDGPPDADVRNEWDKEICRRINEIRSGQAILLEPDVGRNFNRHLGLRTQHLTKEALGSLSILALLYKDLNKITVLVYSAPQITTLTLGRYDDFVEEPTIAARPQAFLDLARVVGTVWHHWRMVS